MPHKPNALDHLTVGEVLRLLDRRPDGKLAGAAVAAAQSWPGQTITAIEIDADEGVVHVDYACTCHGYPGRISARLLRLDAAACPDGAALEFVSIDGAERRSEVFYVSP